jgi:hypothetical protein
MILFFYLRTIDLRGFAKGLYLVRVPVENACRPNG